MRFLHNGRIHIMNACGMELPPIDDCDSATHHARHDLLRLALPAPITRDLT